MPYVNGQVTAGARREQDSGQIAHSQLVRIETRGLKTGVRVTFLDAMRVASLIKGEA